MTRPLEGVLVADFSRVLAGPLAAALLADLGASVVKVERPGIGDDTRAWGPPWTDSTSSYFESANRSKKSIELDLRDEHDLALAKRLASRVDVLIENFKTGTMERRGLGYADVARVNPGIVYASITGFGSHGGRDMPGYDFLIQAMGGLMSITGTPGEPTKTGVALVDVLTSKDAVIGILAALRSREIERAGQHVEVNLLSSLLSSLVNQASAYFTTGLAPVAMGNQHPSIAPYESFRAKDGHLAVCCGNNAQFQALLEVLELPGLSSDKRMATNAGRVVHRAELVDILEAALAADTVDSWTTRLRDAGVAAGKVENLEGAVQLAKQLGLDPTVDVGTGTAQVRNPITFSATPVDVYRRPPRLGEHNDEIRHWLNEESER